MVKIGVALEDWLGQAEIWNISKPGEIWADIEQRREIMTKAARRKVESRISKQSKNIDATR